jgi:hypothetical protein
MSNFIRSYSFSNIVMMIKTKRLITRVGDKKCMNMLARKPEGKLLLEGKK